MSRFVHLVIALSLAGLLPAQQPVAPPSAPPAAPGAAPAAAVAPPMPGQLKAEPASTPSRIPDLPPQPAVVAPTPLSSNKNIPSTSSSGQFIVHGNDLALRSAFSTRCEEIHDELRQLLKDQQSWALPVVVLLSSGESARKADKAVAMTLSEITHGGFHIQVTVNLRPDLRPSDFRAELVRALLAERVLRNQKQTARQNSILPDWIYTGVMEALDYRKQARPSTLFAAIFKSGKIFGIEEIIEASPTQMDALSRTIYKTSCCALVLALLDQPEGGARLQRFLSSLAADARPERELLDQAFPSFASSPASLNKWWALQLANLSRPGLSEPLSPADTVAALEDALTLRYQAKPSEIPQPRPKPVVARIAPSEPAVVSTTKAQETDPVQVAETSPAEVKKGGFFRWLNPFSRRKGQDELLIEEAIEQAAEEEAQARAEEEGLAVETPEKVAANIRLPDQEGPRVEPEEEGKSFFNRWFGIGRRKPAPEEVQNMPQGSKTAASEPSAEVSADEPAKKPSLLNPLNWFRGDKKKEPDPAEPEAPAEPAPKKTTGEASGEPSAEVSSLESDWIGLGGRPLVAIVHQEAASEEADKPKKRRFGLFGGGKKPEEPKKEEPAKEEAKPAPKKESQDEGKKAKAAEKPKTTEAKPEPAKEEPKPSPAAEMPAEAPAEGGTKARRGLRGLFGGGEKKPEPESKPEAAPEPKPEAMAAEAKPEPPKETKPEPAPVEAPPPAAMAEKPEASTEGTKPRRGLRGLFGGGEKKPAEDPKPAETAPTEPKTEPMAAEAKPEADKPKPDEAAKMAEKPSEPEADKPKPEPMRIRPLFGSGKKKEDEAKPEEKPAEPKNEPMAAETKPAEPQPTEPADKSKPAPKPKAVAKEVPKTEKTQPEPQTSQTKPTMPAPKPAEVEKKPAPPAPKPEEEPTIAATVPIEDFSAIMKRPDRKEILQRNLLALTALQQRSAVLFRPIVLEYTALVNELIDGKTKNADEKLKRLRERTQKALDQSKAIRDQLDLHEANSSPAMSGAFEDYLRLPETIEKELPPRQDVISKYLDALDREFSKP